MLTDDQLASLRAQVREASRLRAVYAADRENEEAFYGMVRALLECHSAACTLLEVVEEGQREAALVTPEAPMVVEAAPAAVPGQGIGPRDLLALQRAVTQLWASCAAALAGDLE